MDSGKNAFKSAAAEFLLRQNGVSLPYGIGCAWLGREARGREAAIREAKVLEFAYSSGFRYFDTSAAYGESEIVVGRFVSGIPRESIFLASKSYVLEDVPPPVAAEAVRLGLELSLRRMRTDYLDLFQLHDIFGYSGITEEGGVLDMLLEAKRSGKIRHIGMATRQLDLLEAAAIDGRFDTILTFMDYSPIDRRASDVIRSAQGRGLGVINASPLLFGLLTGGDPERIAVPQGQTLQLERQRKAKELYSLCREQGVSVLALALQFPMRQSAIDITLTGPAKPEEVADSLAAMTESIPETFWQEVERRFGGEEIRMNDKE